MAGPLDLAAEHHEVEVRAIECPAQVGATQLDQVVATFPAAGSSQEGVVQTLEA
jgi:hypothetical protein